MDAAVEEDGEGATIAEEEVQDPNDIQLEGGGRWPNVQWPEESADEATWLLGPAMDGPPSWEGEVGVRWE